MGGRPIKVDIHMYVLNKVLTVFRTSILNVIKSV